MSWSVNVVGKPQAVAEALRAEKEVDRCAEPEESFRQAALELMAQTALAQGDECAVRATGSGSMWRDGDTIKSNNLDIKIEPLYGFLG